MSSNTVELPPDYHKVAKSAPPAYNCRPASSSQSHAGGSQTVNGSEQITLMPATSNASYSATDPAAPHQNSQWNTAPKKNGVKASVKRQLERARFQLVKCGLIKDDQLFPMSRAERKRRRAKSLDAIAGLMLAGIVMIVVGTVVFALFIL